eukprot:TRINITY_DN21844_c0_g1_i4.p1 TRINITY_DN21844_c0_g1~~TRINITY_DN21844_c0_g1_i4.p1  ORF type:complete len:1301 (+),score=168.75 TRINITY_DN21844_c0_g1_i4:101-4003(+)
MLQRRNMPKADGSAGRRQPSASGQRLQERPPATPSRDTQLDVKDDPGDLVATGPTGHAPELALAASGVVLAVMVATMNPTIAPGDSGELVMQCYNLGTAHPPGYPLFTILGFIFVRLVPCGSVAYRVGLLSAVSNAIACFAIALTVAEWAQVRRRSSIAPTRAPAVVCGVAAGVLFAASPLTWLYSTQAEVFALNNALAATLLFFTVRCMLYVRRADVTIGAFLCGLSLTNQHTMVLFCAPLALAVLLRNPSRLLRPGQICGFALAALAPFALFYAYLPLSQTDWLGGPKHFAWGDLRSVNGFLRHLLRREYGTFKLMHSETVTTTDGLWPRLVEYYKDLNTNMLSKLGDPVDGQCLHVGPVVALLGCLHTAFLPHKTWPTGIRRRSPPLGARLLGMAMLFTYVSYLVIFHTLSNTPLDEPLFYGVQMRFWMQPNIIAFVWLGLGLHELVTCGLETGVVGPLCYLLPLLLAFIQISRNYAIQDQSDNYHTEIYGRTMLDSVPQDALMLQSGDVITTSLIYLTKVEKYRPDVDILNLQIIRFPWWKLQRRHYPRVVFPSQQGSVQYRDLDRLISANIGRRDIFLTGDLTNIRRHVETYFELVPHAFGDRVIRRGLAPAWPAYVRMVDRAFVDLNDFPLPAVTKYDERSWERMLLHHHYSARRKLALMILNQAMAEHDNEALLKRALELFNMSTAHSLAIEDFNEWRNFGVTVARLSKTGEYSLGTMNSDLAILNSWGRLVAFPKAAVADGHAAIESYVIEAKDRVRRQLAGKSWPQAWRADGFDLASIGVNDDATKAWQSGSCYACAEPLVGRLAPSSKSSAGDFVKARWGALGGLEAVVDAETASGKPKGDFFEIALAKHRQQHAPERQRKLQLQKGSLALPDLLRSAEAVRWPEGAPQNTSKGVQQPYLSFVIPARNDDFGGDQAGRLRVHLQVLLSQMQQYNLPVEVLLVEWNPPADKPPLETLLPTRIRAGWPQASPRGDSPWTCNVRVVTVPREVHAALNYWLPFAEYCAKNVGIRRARGRFVLVWNLDDLLSPALARFFGLRSLRDDSFYSAGLRFDPVPPAAYAADEQQTAADMLLAAEARSLDDALVAYTDYSYAINNRPENAENLKVFKHVCTEGDLQNVSTGGWYEFNAGDFLLASRQAWRKMHGALEIPQHLHVDSSVFCNLRLHRVRPVQLLAPCYVVHQDHVRRSGELKPGTLPTAELCRRLKERPGAVHPEQRPLADWGHPNAKLPEAVWTYREEKVEAQQSAHRTHLSVKHLEVASRTMARWCSPQAQAGAASWARSRRTCSCRET